MPTNPKSRNIMNAWNFSFDNDITNSIFAIWLISVFSSKNIITEYTVKVANTFNMFYNSHLVLNLEDKELMKARLILVEATCQVIKNALDLIGIEVVEDI